MDIKKEIISFLKTKKGLISFYLLLDVMLLVLNILNPYLSGNYVNVLIISAAYEYVVKYTVCIIIIGAFNVLTYYALRMIQIRLTTYLQHTIECKYINLIKGKKLFFMQMSNSAYLVQKVHQSTSIIVAFGVYVLDFFVKGIQVLILLGMLFYINREICLFLFLLLPIYTISYFVIKKYIYKSNYDVQNQNNILYNEINQQIEQLKFIKSTSKYRYFETRLDCEYDKYINNILINNNYTNIFLSASLIINKVAMVIVFFVGGLKIVEQNLDIGSFTIIMSYFVSIMDCIKTFFLFANEYEKYNVAKKRLDEISNIPDEEDGNEICCDIDSIKICNLKYRINGHLLIDGFSYHFKKGNIYLLKGKNGAGKSTFFDILLGINAEYTGTILFNDTNIRALNMKKVRKDDIAIFLQEPYLFIGTMIENICLDEGIIEEEIEVLCEKLGWQEIIEKKGLDYEINEKASNLSGGEKQKIALLRSLLRKTSVVVLDEPTSWMDTEGYSKLIEYLATIKFDKIILVISHEKEFEMVADHIIEF